MECQTGLGCRKASDGAWACPASPCCFTHRCVSLPSQRCRSRRASTHQCNFSKQSSHVPRLDLCPPHHMCSASSACFLPQVFSSGSLNKVPFKDGMNAAPNQSFHVPHLGLWPLHHICCASSAYVPAQVFSSGSLNKVTFEEGMNAASKKAGSK